MLEATSLLILSGITLLIPNLRSIYFRMSESSKNQPSTTLHIPYFDFLRGISILAVILIHVIYFYKISFSLPNIHSSIIFSLNNILRFAIPFFLITSGILLTPFSFTLEKYKQFLYKKAVKLLLPYFICCVFIALYHHQTWWEFIKLTLTGFMAVPYYFICILFQAYLLYPIILKYSNRKFFLPFFFLFSIACYALPSTWLVFGFPFVGRYIFFFAYGIKIRNFFLHGKMQKKESLSWLSLILLYLALSIALPGYYYNVRLIYGVALFNLLMIIKPFIRLENFFGDIIMAFGRKSLFIFLTHFGLVGFLFTFLHDSTKSPLFNVFLITLLSICGSYILAAGFEYIYKKILLFISKTKALTP